MRQRKKGGKANNYPQKMKRGYERFIKCILSERFESLFHKTLQREEGPARRKERKSLNRRVWTRVGAGVLNSLQSKRGVAGGMRTGEAKVLRPRRGSFGNWFRA